MMRRAGRKEEPPHPQDGRISTACVPTLGTPLWARENDGTQQTCTTSKAEYKLQATLKLEQVKKASLNGKWILLQTFYLHYRLNLLVL